MMDLKYEHISNTHLEYIKSIWSDKEVIKYINIKEHCLLEEMKNRILKFINNDVYIVKLDKEVIGIVGCLSIDKEKRKFGFFYQLKKSAWGKGIGTESALWMLDYMKRKYGSFILYADVVSENIASDKILGKLGFKLISEEIEAFELEEYKSDIKNYCLKVNSKSLAEIIYKGESDLLKSDVRKSADKISVLLSKDYKEITSSGYIYYYKKGDVYQEKNDDTELNWEIKDFSIKELSKGCVLANYMVIKHNKADENEKYSYRSSIWKLYEGQWKMFFHQGTLTKL